MREVIIAYRRVLVVVIHTGLWVAGLALATLLRFDFALPHRFIELYALKLVALSLIVRTLVHWWLGLFHGLWRYSSSRDLLSLMKA